MSRVGKKTITIPDDTKIVVEKNKVIVRGPKGELQRTLPELITVTVENNHCVVKRNSESRAGKSLHGLTRTLIANMVKGVTEGFEKVMEMRGIGYRAQVQDRKLSIFAGFSHPIEYDIPDGLEVKVEKRPVVEQLAITHVTISGIDKELVSQFGARIRKIRMPEPYKGKGIRSLGEQVRRKAGKSAV